MEQNNKLIAEFMGLTNHHNDNSMMVRKKPEGNVVLYVYDLDYDSSWDWLMPVVEKIEYIESITHGNQFQVIIREEEVGIYDKHTQTHIVYISSDGESKLTNTYKAVVEFIKEYNQND